MKKDKSNYQKMMESCPILYRQRKLPMSKTCMCWGIECGKGWFEPLNKLSHKLERLNNYYKNDYVCIEASQVKEKFGTLRFYYDICFKPTKIRQFFINILNIIKYPFNKFKYKFINVVDKEAYVSEEWDEISKEDYDNKKIREYVSNKFGWKFKEENGKYYRNCELNHPPSCHKELTNYKLMYKVKELLDNLIINLEIYEHTDRQLMIRDALSSEAFKLVSEAESECYNHCELCGRQIGIEYSPRIATKGWVTYICKYCDEKKKKESEKE